LFKRNKTKNCKGYSNTKNAFRCQILVLRDYRFQFNIKIYSEGVMITNFISKSLEFIGTVEPSFAAITTPLKRSGNS